MTNSQHVRENRTAARNRRSSADARKLTEKEDGGRGALRQRKGQEGPNASDVSIVFLTRDKDRISREAQKINDLLPGPPFFTQSRGDRANRDQR